MHIKLREQIDELYINIILSLPDDVIVLLPDDISLPELARRFPEVYERALVELKGGVHDHLHAFRQQ